jgi:HAD superfamily phosphoserine phosphatase-like hydrolase
MSEANPAVFVRVEGVLTARGACGAAAYMAANAAGLRERVVRLGHLALATPLYEVLGQSDRVLANRLTYLALRNMSEDRIAELADEYWRNVLSRQVLQSGVELLKRARSQGLRIVLMSDCIEEIVRPLAEQMPSVDKLLCNRLEYREGLATGKLCDPVIGGHDGGQFLARYAQEHGIDLARSTAYGAHGPDVLLMTAVGQPCAVNPDFTLRRAARDAGWPVMDFHV